MITFIQILCSIRSICCSCTTDILTRDEIDEQSKWNLSLVYSNTSSFFDELDKLPVMVDILQSFAGELGHSHLKVGSVLLLKDRITRKISKLHTYSSALLIQNMKDPEAISLNSQVLRVSSKAAAAMAWIQPELMKLSQHQFNRLKNSPHLRDYQRQLEDIERWRPHSLTQEGEEILSLLSDPLGSFQQVSLLFMNSDLKYPHLPAQTPSISNSSNQEKECALTNSLLRFYQQSPDRGVRNSSLTLIHQTLQDFSPSLSTLLLGKVKAASTTAAIRNFSSGLELALFKEAVPVAVYDSLIKAVHHSLPIFFQYLNLRQRTLAVPVLHMYDMQVPLVPSVEIDIPFDDAVSVILKSLAPLGENYTRVASEILHGGWVDRFPSVGKQAGARSMGSYDTPAFISLNYQNTLPDLFTLAHELGHSMHSTLSKAKQPHQTHRYTIFVAEVASNVNEALLMDYLLLELAKPTPDLPPSLSNKQLFPVLIGWKCDKYRTTLFRQALFAEFEMIVDQLQSSQSATIPTPASIFNKTDETTRLTGVPTPALLADIYLNLTKLYYGDTAYYAPFGPVQHIFSADPTDGYEYLRVPHFYYSFYVYKYATSFCASQVIAAELANPLHTIAFRKRYLNLLSDGGRHDPLDQLKTCGVDMSMGIEPIYAQTMILFEKDLLILKKSLGDNN
ncbi:putative Oligoendopeptidase F like protein [Blattamonas nauphoetae]|uniref:Oligoendopeptidase F like protein n=1 Tax=Blattamonas nauphoetae TaxID=2049346 RepID=A0ABQ9Y1R6_9EUKA|nr:putative Oligoendopeptidase F like protein [Blattamonas nauphoetae]